MKKLFACGVNLLLLLCLISVVGAEEETGTYQIGETTASITEDASGDGWSFDAQTLTLTLDGISLGDDWETSGIDFSNAEEGIQIVLAPGSVNQIHRLHAPYEKENVIRGGGSLTVGMYNGGMIIVEDGSISVGTLYCSMVVNGGYVQSNGFYGETLDVTGGEVTLGRTKAADMVYVSGGTLNVEDLDVYAFRMTGGAVNAGQMSNCNGTGIAWMRYELSGGTFTLGNDDPEDRFFLCVAVRGDIREFHKKLSVFANQLKDENGDPLTVKYYYYDDNDEMLENPPASYCGYMVANLYNKDGTPATYGKAELSKPCQHESEEIYRRITQTGHCMVCGLCGGDVEDTERAHEYVSYGTVKLCACGALDPDVEYDREFDKLHEEDVTEEIVRLGLEMWLGLFPTNRVMQGTLDPEWEGWIGLEDVARLQLIAQGVEAPETLIAFGTAYSADGKAMQMITQPEDLEGDWDMVKVFVLDSETYAPLTDPITVEK